MNATAPPGSNRNDSPIAVDRLYVLWIISSLMVVLAVVVIALITGGHLRRQTDALIEQAASIETLRNDLAALQERVAGLQEIEPPPQPKPATERPRPAAPAPEPPAPAQSPPSSTPGPARQIDALLDTALAVDRAGHPALRDSSAAQRALAKAQAASELPPKTNARLALAAALMGQHRAAELFASRAATHGAAPNAYYEFITREHLAAGRALEATVFARRLRTELPQDPKANLLLAAALASTGDLGSAGEALREIRADKELHFDDRLLLAALLLETEQVPRLGEVLAGLADAAPARVPEVNYLRATYAILRNQLVEGLAILEELLADRPDDDGLQVLQAAALIKAGRHDEARALLKAVEPGPDAAYWLGTVELQDGNVAQAIAAFQQALNAAPRHSPAWEALATIALNDGDLPSAGTYVDNAIAANPWRASPHLLRAIVKAKSEQPDEARASLRTAVQLDPLLVEPATQAEVLHPLASAEELRAFAAEQTD